MAKRKKDKKKMFTQTHNTENKRLRNANPTEKNGGRGVNSSGFTGDNHRLNAK